MSHCQPINSSLQDAVFLLSAGESVIHSDGRAPCSPREQTSEAMEQDGRGHWGRRKAPHGECRTLLNRKLACLLMNLVCCYHQSWWSMWEYSLIVAENVWATHPGQLLSYFQSPKPTQKMKKHHQMK